jgi:hypothetical protein
MAGTLQDYVLELVAHLDAFQSQTMTADETYQVLVTAAITKAAEFARHVHEPAAASAPFFLTPTLRGICEDLIALSFAKSIPEPSRSRWLLALSMHGTSRSVAAQAAFFRAERPFQPVLAHRAIAEIEQSSHDQLVAMKKQQGWAGKGLIPSVSAMARHVGLAQLYSYLYHATSEWVHFSPRLLMRMGWQPTDANPETFHFSTQHFSDYYLDFNQIYSAHLLTLQVRGFHDTIGIDVERMELTRLEAALSNELIWPELVTFREMNVEPPALIIRAVMKGMHQRSTETKG